MEHFTGEGWWNRFTKRHPTLSLCTSDPYQQEPMLYYKGQHSAYFSLLEETLKDHDLLDKPPFIYNMDKSGMPLDHRQPKRVATKGTKKVHGPASGVKTQITICMFEYCWVYTFPNGYF